MAATVVNVKQRNGYVVLSAYDNDNGNKVVNTLNVGISVALEKDGAIVDGTKVFLNPNESKTYNAGLGADNVVVFTQKVGSLIEPSEIYAG